MDTTVPRKNRKKQYIALSLLAFFLLAALGIYLANRPRTLHVKRAEILIKK